MDRANRQSLPLKERLLIGTLVFVALVMIGIGAAHAAEIVPSVGLARAAASDGTAREAAIRF